MRSSGSAEGPRGAGISGVGQCRHCAQQSRCIRATLDEASRNRFDNAVIHLPPLRAGERLHLTGEPADAIYVVKSGTITHRCVTPLGHEAVCGFHFAGSALQCLPGACLDCQDSWGAAEPSRLCRIRTSLFTREQQKHFAGLYSDRIREEYDFHMGLIDTTPEQRLAALLLRISAKQRRRRVRLALAPADIACYLDVSKPALEVAFQVLIGCRCIQASAREVLIVDAQALLHLMAH